MFKFIQRQHFKLGGRPHVMQLDNRLAALAQRFVDQLRQFVLTAGTDQNVDLFLLTHLFRLNLDVTAHSAHQSVRVLPAGLMDFLPALAGGGIGHRTGKYDVNVGFLLEVHRLIAALPQRLSGTFRLVGVDFAAQR